MNTYQKELIKEHKDLTLKIGDIYCYVYNGGEHKDNPVEFANKCIQLRGMRMYEESLRARLASAGIIVDNGVYFEKVEEIYESVENNKSCECTKATCDTTSKMEPGEDNSNKPSPEDIRCE